MGSGFAFQRFRVARVSSQPWTTASCSAFMYQWIGRELARLQRAPPPRPVAQRRNAPSRLERDLRGHLRFAQPALAEADRHLDDLQSEQQRAVGELDLEGVALRA